MTINTFTDEGEFTADTVEEFDRILDDLIRRHEREPILVEISSPTGAPALVGFGSGFGTIEMFSPLRDKHICAVVNDGASVESVVFNYAGERTEVYAPFLIPEASGRRAIRRWLTDGTLDDGVAWRIDDHPPKKARRS